MKDYKDLIQSKDLVEAKGPNFKKNAKKIDKLFADLLAELRTLSFEANQTGEENGQMIAYEIKGTVGYNVQNARNDWNNLSGKRIK